MTITLYNNKSDDRVLTKDITLMSSSVNADIKGSTDIVNPVLILDYNSADFNYIYVPDWDRYYFVIGIVVSSGGRMTLSARCDPLMTFRSDISALSCNISRSESIVSEMQVDTLMPLSVKKQTTMYNVGENIIGSGHTFVLGVIS